MSRELGTGRSDDELDAVINRKAEITLCCCEPPLRWPWPAAAGRRSQPRTGLAVVASSRARCYGRPLTAARIAVSAIALNGQPLSLGAYRGNESW